MIPRSQPRTLAIFALLRFFFLLTAFTLDLTAAEPAAAADDNYQMPQRKARRPLVVCGKNTELLNYRSHLSCYSNCDNRHSDPTVECLKTIHFGEFCHCQDGFIFLEGTRGDCVRPEQCPRPPKTAMHTLPITPKMSHATPKNLCGANSQSMESHFNLMCYDNCQNKDQRECGTNAHFTNSRGNERCIDNCPNYKQGPKFCTRELYFGSFCQCNSGFIFLNGTDGACVRPDFKALL
ncbi:hypothetical protein TYRP_005324 [Tyrophagus putrescentiae]|nr:hypothetical protein TYRP_005324 [Tyrophagus putrescentiae]